MPIPLPDLTGKPEAIEQAGPIRADLARMLREMLDDCPEHSQLIRAEGTWLLEHTEAAWWVKRAYLIDPTVMPWEQKTVEWLWRWTQYERQEEAGKRLDFRKWYGGFGRD